MLKIPPEQRYQDRKINWFFHDSSYCRRGLNAYDGQGCNAFTGCVPECRYYPKYGRIEDEEVIREHKEFEQRYRDSNAIIEPPNPASDYYYNQATYIRSS